MISVRNLTKRYGDAIAVDDVSFDVQPGRVTGFLGPNGAGKSTTMRMILGLDAPTAGTARIGGRRYADLRLPLRTIGALLDARAVDGGRTAEDHLAWLAASNAIHRSRIAEVLRTVGLTSVAGRRVDTFSLGMRQRLGIAAAILGDPEVVMLDEPANGLDPDGILWLRAAIRQMAREGRAVFVSSHLMSEVAQTADHLIVIGRGRLIADAPIDHVLSQHDAHSVHVRSEHQARLAQRVTEHGGAVEATADGAITVRGLAPAAIGAIAVADRIVLSELTPQHASLEEAFFELTRGLELSTADVAPHGEDS